MNHYELLFVLPGTLAENEVMPGIEKVKTVITENGGLNLEMSENDKRRLAYPVKQIRYGYFQLAYFEAEPASVKLIEAKLRIMPELLRAMVYKYNPSEKKEKKINFGTLGLGEDGRRPETAVEIGVPATIAAPAEEVVEVMVQSEEKKKLEAAPVKKASAKKEEKKKVNLDDIDKKLDEILDMGLDNV